MNNYMTIHAIFFFFGFGGEGDVVNVYPTPLTSGATRPHNSGLIQNLT